MPTTIVPFSSKLCVLWCQIVDLVWKLFLCSLRIKHLIKKEQSKLAQKIQHSTPTAPIVTTTPRPVLTTPRPVPIPLTSPSPNVIDYDYNEDYYYYDDMNRGEPLSELSVKTVDEDYDEQFYHYSDDGEEPEYMQFTKEELPGLSLILHYLPISLTIT